MKTVEKKKTKAKAKAKSKVAAKLGRKAAKLGAVAAMAAAMYGCSTAESAQPAKSATLTTDIRDSVIIVSSKVRIPAKGSTNDVIEIDGGDLPSLEIMTITQSLESNGSETFSPTSTQTPTTDVKPDLDVRYNDAIAGASSTSRGILESLGSVLTDAGRASLLAMIESKSSGTVTLGKKDGGQVAVKCVNGACSECTDCEVAR